ncbi:MAG: hypothetical protein M1435_03450 [Actinobacteria bacterium]|nr:hypothetical protein [Actinomycetota bacterium]
MIAFLSWVSAARRSNCNSNFQVWTPQEPVSPADLDPTFEGYREWALAMLEDPDEALL